MVAFMTHRFAPIGVAIILQVIAHTNAAQTCIQGEYSIKGYPGNCYSCPKCPKGYGADRKCSHHRIYDPRKIPKCTRCIQGETFSEYNSTGMCDFCSPRNIPGHVVVKECTPTHDLMVAYSPGTYEDDALHQCKGQCCKHQGKGAHVVAKCLRDDAVLGEGRIYSSVGGGCSDDDSSETIIPSPTPISEAVTKSIQTPEKPDIDPVTKIYHPPQATKKLSDSSTTATSFDATIRSSIRPISETITKSVQTPAKPDNDPVQMIQVIHANDPSIKIHHPSKANTPRRFQQSQDSSATAALSTTGVHTLAVTVVFVVVAVFVVIVAAYVLHKQSGSTSRTVSLDTSTGHSNVLDLPRFSAPNQPIAALQAHVYEEPDSLLETQPLRMIQQDTVSSLSNDARIVCQASDDPAFNTDVEKLSLTTNYQGWIPQTSHRGSQQFLDLQSPLSLLPFAQRQQLASVLDGRPIQGRLNWYHLGMHIAGVNGTLQHLVVRCHGCYYGGGSATNSMFSTLQTKNPELRTLDVRDIAIRLNRHDIVDYLTDSNAINIERYFDVNGNIRDHVSDLLEQRQENINYWLHFAACFGFSQEDVKHFQRQKAEPGNWSPTLELLIVLCAYNPQLSIGELKAAARYVGRQDVCRLIDQMIAGLLSAI